MPVLSASATMRSLSRAMRGDQAVSLVKQNPVSARHSRATTPALALPLHPALAARARARARALARARSLKTLRQVCQQACRRDVPHFGFSERGASPLPRGAGVDLKGVGNCDALEQVAHAGIERLLGKLGFDRDPGSAFQETALGIRPASAAYRAQPAVPAQTAIRRMAGGSLMISIRRVKLHPLGSARQGKLRRRS